METEVIAKFLLVTFLLSHDFFFFYCRNSASGRLFVKTCLIPQRYGFGYGLEGLLSFNPERFELTKLQCSGGYDDIFYP
jgi:hypothetical protein